MVLTVTFVAIQLVSLAVMILFVHEYKRISRKHEELLHTIEEGVKPSCKIQSTIIIWIYAAVMLAILFVTTSIFLMNSYF